MKRSIEFNIPEIPPEFIEEKELILSFHKELIAGKVGFHDLDEFEMMIDYYLAVGRNQLGLLCCDSGLLQFPFSSELKIKQAQIYYYDENFPALERSLFNLAKIEPKNPDYMLLRARLLAHKSKHHLAAEWYHKWYKGIKEFDDQIVLEWIDNLIAANRLQQAHQVTTHFISKKESERDTVRDLWGYFDQFISDDKLQSKSLKFINDHIDSDPYDSYAWIYLGKTYETLENNARAIWAYEMAIAIEEGNSEPYLLKAKVQQQLELNNEALKTLKGFSDDFESDEKIYCALAENYERIEYFQLAQHYYQKALEIDPECIEAYLGLGFTMSFQDRLNESMSYFDKALELDMTNIDAYLLKAQSLENMDLVDEAFEVYEEAIDIDPEVVETWDQYIQSLLENEEYETAFDKIAEAEALLGEELAIKLKKIDALIRTGKMQQAALELGNAIINDSSVIDEVREHYANWIENPHIAKLLNLYNQ